MNPADLPEAESFNPWSVVNSVFAHLADHGLHPVLGESGDPAGPARGLLLTLGIEPAAEGTQFEESMSTHYARMIHEDDRTIMFANPEDAAEYIGFDLKTDTK